MNKSLDFNFDFLKEYQDFLSWGKISRNRNIIWTEEIIKYFENRWDWGGLIKNKNIKWSLNMINQFKRNIDFSDIFMDHYSPYIEWHELPEMANKSKFTN